MAARLIKRGDIWFAWVPVLGGGTRKVTTQCTDKKAAEKRAGELEREAVDPSYAAANKATTAGACDEFLDSRKRRGRAEGTLHHYRVKLGHVVRLMPARLGDIDAGSCERFISQRLDEGAAQTTVKKEIRALGATLRHARRNGVYLRVVEAVIPELEETYKPRERFLAPMEFVALCNTLGPLRAAHVVFMVCTGARWGESVRARLEDIEGSRVLLRGTKTKTAWRTVPVPPTLRIALAWSLAHRRDESGGALFEPWGNVRRDIGVACKNLGIAPVTPNDLRRTFATWLRMSGVTPDLIGAALGHTTSRMADLVYGRISPTALDRLISERGPALAMSESTQKESEVLGLLMGGDVAETGVSGAVAETPNLQETREIQCPGTESNRRHGDFQSLEIGSNDGVSAISDESWAANGLTFGARARRWLMRRAA